MNKEKDIQNTIMIIDDDDIVIESLKKQLGNFYNLIVCKNGIEALKYFDNNKTVDVIVSDIMMPEMDGFEFIYTLREERKIYHIPLIFITGYLCDEYHKIKGLKLGAIDYILKPFSKGEILNKVKNIIDLQQNMKELLTAS